MDKTNYKPDETSIPPPTATDDTLKSAKVIDSTESQTVEVANNEEQVEPNQDYQEPYQENPLSYQIENPPTFEENPQNCQESQLNYQTNLQQHHPENIPQNYHSLPAQLNHQKPVVNQYNHIHDQPPSVPRMPQPRRAPACPVREKPQMYHTNPPDYPPPQLINAHLPPGAMDQRIQYPPPPPTNEHPSRPNRQRHPSGGRGNRRQNSIQQENQFNCPQVIQFIKFSVRFFHKYSRRKLSLNPELFV